MIGLKENKVSTLVEKFREIEIAVSGEKGDFNLFALMEREDAFGKWDVVVSASWIGKDDKVLINAIASRIKKSFTQDEQLKLSRIVILPPSDPLVQNLNLIAVEHSSVKLSNNTFNGIVIKESYLITSKK